MNNQSEKPHGIPRAELERIKRLELLIRAHARGLAKARKQLRETIEGSGNDE